jgi:hypothetical protein
LLSASSGRLKGAIETALKQEAHALRTGLINRYPFSYYGVRAAAQPGIPAPAPALTLREGVNVLLTRTEEIQKVHSHVFAGLAVVWIRNGS